MAELIRRNLENFMADVVKTFPVAVVQGARQVGKSTLAAQFAAQPSRVFTLDDNAVRGAVADDPLTFLTAPGDGPLVLDEVQRAPELLLDIKAEVDRHRRPGRFILTGSSDLLRLQGNPESLAGRAVTVPLRPLSQGELIGRFDDFISAVTNGKFASGAPAVSSLTRSDYAELVGRGGYPEVQGLSPRMRSVWFDSYLDRVLKRDAREIRALRPERLAACLRLLAANQAGELVKARLAHDSAIHAGSITDYLDLLETLFLVERLQPWTPNLTQREVGRPKMIVGDSGLALRLAAGSAQTLADPLQGKLFGALLEGLVVSELRKQQTWSGTEFDLFHFRENSSGLEVDVVVELPDGRVVGIDVKASSTHRQDHAAGLLRLRDKLGDRFFAGIILTTAQRGFDHASNIRSLPIGSLWEEPTS